MDFKFSCFIRKNTEELRKKLSEFGCITDRGNRLVNSTALLTHNGRFYSVYPVRPARHYQIFDCGENEELFLALAAARHDSDKFQWFICNENCLNLDAEPISAGEWQFNDRYEKLPRRLRDKWKKATYKDILEHFNWEQS